MRDVGRSAGCTHALVTRYYGSKAGLVDAVAEQLTRGVTRTVDQLVAHDADPLVGTLAAGRSQPSCVRLLVRSALGDIEPEEFPECVGARRVVSAAPNGASLGRSRRSRVIGYAAASLVLGWLTFEEFVVAATGLGRVDVRRRDAAVAASASEILALAGSAAPSLRVRNLAPTAGADESADDPSESGRSALLSAAVELFSQHGPASVSVRDVSRLAGANSALIYRHFGSKDALLEAAIEHGVSDLLPAALDPEGFDFDEMSRQLHSVSPAPRLLARALVDGTDIRTVRRKFPVLGRLLSDLAALPTAPVPSGPSDPRVAVAAAAGLTLGSAIWGPHLAPAFDLSDSDGVVSAVADLARHLVSLPAAAQRA